MTIIILNVTFVLSWYHHRSFWMWFSYCYLPFVVVLRLIPSVTYHNNVDFKKARSLLKQFVTAHKFLVERVPPASLSKHPNLRTQRNDARTWMINQVRELGMSPYMVQPAEIDVREGIPGRLRHYSVKDLHSEPFEDPFNPHDKTVVCMVNSDYYLEEEDWNALAGAPILIYTMRFEAPALSRPEYTYRWNGKVYEIKVAGGAEYRHKVWSYDRDSVVIGKGENAYVYDVVTHDHGDHRLVTMVPNARVPEPLLGTDLPRLARLNPTETATTYKLAVMSENLQFAISIKGAWNSRTYPADFISSLIARALTSKTSMDYGSASSIAETRGLKVDCTEATTYVREATRDGDDYVPVFSYQRACYSEPTAGAEPSLTVLAAPIQPGAAYAPVRSKASDEATIEERLNDVAPKSQKFGPEVAQYLQEFIELVVPEPLELHPCETDEVSRRQPRKTQQDLLRQGLYYSKSEAGKARTKVAAFQKAETYGKPSPPRNISTVAPPVKVWWASYIYVLADYIAGQRWYAFKTPREVEKSMARHYQSTAADKSFINVSDYSKFDGSYGAAGRYMEIRLLKRVFAKEHHADITQLHSQVQNRNANTKFRVKYNSGSSRLSGEPGTSVFNSTFNAAVVYMAFRLSGMTPRQAFDSLGLYGGDDGATLGLDPKFHEQAAHLVQMNLEIQVIKETKPFPFLGRKFAWSTLTGSPNSCCDIDRQVAKLHLSHQNGVLDPKQKLREKCEDLLRTDPNTPILGPYAEKVVKNIAPPKKPSKGTPESWWATFESDVQFTNKRDDWMYSTTKLDVASVEAAIAKSTIDNLLTRPILVPAEIKKPPYDTIINGELVKGAKPGKRARSK